MYCNKEQWYTSRLLLNNIFYGIGKVMKVATNTTGIKGIPLCYVNLKQSLIIFIHVLCTQYTIQYRYY